MNKLIRPLLLIIFSALLLSCTGAAVPEPTPEPVTITFYKRGYTEGGTDITSTTNAKAVEAFEKANPNINVEIVGVPWTADGDTLLAEALESGEKINVFSVNPDDLIRFAKEGKVSNIEPFLTKEDQADIYPSGLQAAAVDGKVYAWPIWVTASSIYANPELFQEQGVDLPTIEDPWTWDEFVEAAKKLTYQRADGSQVYGFSTSTEWWTSGFYPIFYIDGGRVLSPDGKRFVQNSLEGISGLQKAVDLKQVYQVTPPDFGLVKQADSWQQFKNGEIAMLLETPAFIRQLEEEEFPVVILPPPTGNLGKIVTTGGFGMYSVYNVDDPDKVEASHKFAKYITGSQVAEDVPGYQLAPSLRRSNTSYATSPNREIIARLVEFGVYEAPVPVPPEVGQKYTEALTQIVTGEKNPGEAMDEIAPLYQQTLDEVWQ